MHPQLARLKPTAVLDTYWRFAAERQALFFRRLRGDKAPWTTDPILQGFRFTNAYRASDRVSQYLIKKVIYREDLPSTPRELFFRTVLFKLFNKVETWERIERSLGAVTFDACKTDRVEELLSSTMARGGRIYSAAYIMPGDPRGGAKHRFHLRLLDKMVEDDLPQKIADATEFRQVFELLRSYTGIGDFLAYQLATDLNYSPLINFEEADLVIPGPGAIDGLSKCFAGWEPRQKNGGDVILRITDEQENAFERLGIDFQNLWGRRLQPIDCQNLFCEVSKYSRVKHPEVTGVAGRTRIKQHYRPATTAPDRPWYPPKWGINQQIQQCSSDSQSLPLPQHGGVGLRPSMSTVATPSLFGAEVHEHERVPASG